MYQLFIVLILVGAALSKPCELPVPACGIFRNYDGTCNNPVHREWGQVNSYLTRGAEGAWYEDGVRSPVLTPNMRTVSNELFRADDSKMQEDGLNLLWVFFGQFITHDMMGVHRRGDNAADLTQPTNNSDVWVVVPLEQINDSFNISIPRITVNHLRILRSRGDVVNGVFQIGSDSTSYLDLDIVYGKDEHIANLLRKKTGGELKYGVYNNYTAVPAIPSPLPAGTTIPPSQIGNYGEWMPLVHDIDPNRTLGIPISPQLVVAFTQNIPKRFFATGDGRNGENYGLNVLHGLFLREHNRIARLTAIANPSWTDEQVFQHARKVNIAQYQAVVLYEYLPTVLGSDYNIEVGDYDGYDVFTDATVSNLFAFAFRFGHTTVPDMYKLKNKCGGPAFNSSRDGPRSGQAAAIFMPADQMAQVGKPENILHGLMFENARAVDFQFAESLRTIPGAAVDITVQNQLRAAENGVPDYNTIRKLWHGGKHASVYDAPKCDATESSASPDPLPCWLLVTSNSTAAARLQSLYGKVNKLNFYTAVVGEEPTRAVVGQTSARIIADQFKRARAGDRWWFENEDNGLFTRAQAREIKRKTTMDVLLARNFPTLNAPEDAFYVPKPRFLKKCNVNE